MANFDKSKRAPNTEEASWMDITGMTWHRKADAEKCESHPFLQI